MPQFSYRQTGICLECSTPCCQHVKRMPYMGESHDVLYRTLLLGAFPLWTMDTVSVSHFWAMEWIVPAELDRCPAYSESRLCNIYDRRPISCRNFPVIGLGGKMHDFCPHPHAFSGVHLMIPDFLEKIDKIESFVKTHYHENEGKKVAGLILEKGLASVPLLYNGLWCLFLVVAKMNVCKAIESQRFLLKQIRSGGHQELTVLIPHSDYCVTCDIEGLMHNLDYLEARCEQDELLEKCHQIVSRILDR